MNKEKITAAIHAAEAEARAIEGISQNILEDAFSRYGWLKDFVARVEGRERELDKTWTSAITESQLIAFRERKKAVVEIMNTLRSVIKAEAREQYNTHQTKRARPKQRSAEK